jgi:hypothetical protein
MKFTYSGIRVQQQPEASPFYLTTVPAYQLLEWADVPRKKAAFMAGYQRELLDRHRKITEFIEKSPGNVVPGAIIIAVNGSAVSFEETAVPGVVNVTISYEEKPFEERLQALASEFLQRLGESERKSIEFSETEFPSQDLDEDEDEEEEPQLEEVPPESYLAQLTSELQQAVRDFSSLPTDRQNAVKDYVDGVSKPARILDGQHRVFGAKNVSDFDVFLPVVLMPGLSTSEQVFHFYVLNNKAKPLSATELRGTVSTSLTNFEIGKLYWRFKQAGVTAEEARWTHRANTDEESPFRGLIDFGLGDARSFIPENVAHQLIGRFVKPTRRLKLLYKDVPEWMDDSDFSFRLSMFYAFWRAIKDKYPVAWLRGVERGGGQIFMKATMVVLQELVLDKLNGAMPGRAANSEPSYFADADDLNKAVTSNLYFLPEEFFLRDWSETGLDTSERRKFLRLQMDDAIQKGGKKIGHLQLFKVKG